MNRRYLFATVMLAPLFAVSFGVIAWLSPAPRFIWNATASAPVGLYRVDAAAAPHIGDLVAITPPADIAAWLARRHYVPRGVPLLKRVAALPGARVCRSGVFVTVDGIGVARALARERAGRLLPVWSGCRILGTHDIFLINAAPGSLDGRYFGSFPAKGLLGVARPLCTRAVPGSPLRCSRGAARPTHPCTEEETCS